MTGGAGGTGGVLDPSKDSVCVRCVGNAGRATGATTGGRGNPPNGGTTCGATCGAGAAIGAGAGAGAATGAAATTGAALPLSRAPTAFFSLSMNSCVSNGLSMKSSTPASLPRAASYGLYRLAMRRITQRGSRPRTSLARA